MTPDEIKQLRDLAAKATPGPWDHGAHGELYLPSLPRQAGSPCIGEMDDLADAAYLAACSPERIMALCDALENQAELADLVAKQPTCETDHDLLWPCRSCWARELLSD